MAAFDFDDGIVVVSLVAHVDKTALHEFIKGRPEATGIRVMVPMSTWLDSKKVAEISTIASEHKMPMSFQSVDLPSKPG